MVEIQKLIKEGVKEIYVNITSERSFNEFIDNIDFIKYFKNSSGFCERNIYSNDKGKICYLGLNLISKEIAFSRTNLNPKLYLSKTIVSEDSKFNSKGSKIKLSL
jgi:hypothetical protein